VVALDAELLNVIRDVLARRDGQRAAPAPAPSAFRPTGPRAGEYPTRPGRDGSGLAPREIQARLRAGRSIGEVALEAGVDEDWVRRFAPPVFAEQTHVVSRALSVTFHAEGRGPSREALFESVAANLLARGVVLTADELEEGWSAFQMRDSAWVVQFRTSVGTKELLARWGFDVRANTLVALNRAGAELGWVGADDAGRSAFAAVDDLADDSETDHTGERDRPVGVPQGAPSGDVRPEEAPAAARAPRRRASALAKRSASAPAAGDTVAPAAGDTVAAAAGDTVAPAGGDTGAPVARDTVAPTGRKPVARTARETAADDPAADGQAALPLTGPGSATRAAPRGPRRRAGPRV
jgi:hypothetical protein